MAASDSCSQPEITIAKTTVKATDITFDILAKT
jgi:hypothetical protein